MQSVIDLLLQLGWLRDGQTRVETVRLPTRETPVYGRGGVMGGKLVTQGGRTRFHLSGTRWYATVGKRSACAFQHDGQRPHA